MSLKYFFKVGDNNYLVEVLRRFLYSRWYVRTPPVQTCSTHFDRSMQTMLAEFRKHHGLDRQLNVFPMGSLLDAATYQKIGDEMSDAEIAMAALHDSEIKKLLYGNPCADWETVGKVITKDQFVGWGHKAIKENCFDYCKEQLRVVGRAMKSPYWGDKTMKAHIYQLYLTEDVAGMKKGIQPRQFINAVKYLKQALKGKVPVVTGVDNEEGSPNKDKVTDHFVTIVGMGTDSHGKYFHFFDNAAGDKTAGTSDNNKLYPDCDAFMITGTGDNDYARGLRHYIVTQVRVSE